MKKVTLMLMAALLAVVSFAGTPVRKTMPTGAPRQMSAERHFVPQRKATPASLPMAQKAATKMRKAVRQTAPRRVSNIDELTGKRMLYSFYYTLDDDNQLTLAEPSMGATPVTITKGSGTTLEIEGFTSDATEKIVASVDLEEGTISIADGQTLLTDEEYGAIILCNVQEEGAPITGTINDDGTVDFDQLWCALIEAGQYEGYEWTDFYYYSGLVPVNGTMKWEDEDGACEADLYIYQNEEDLKSVEVFNFGGWETMIVVTLKEDQTFVIDNQLVWDGGSTYGQFYTYGFDEEGENPVALTGKGTDTVLTFDCNWTAYASTGYWYGLQSPATITLTDGSTLTYPNIPDVAATPADPEIVEVGPYDAEDGYGSVFMSIPTTDADGNDLKEDKLFYTLYADIAGEISQITFTPDICEKLTENLTEIPYTFTDDWDFQTREGYKVVFLNYDFSNYDRIGVQSIYYGGEECHKTEIQWYEIEKPSDEPIFDFNSMDVATSGANSTAGDITAELTLTAANVTLTISPKDESVTTENRFWSTGNGPQLRVYSGTLTFTVPEDYAITEIVFNAGRWNNDNTADSGEFSDYDSDSKEVIWTGNAQEVVANIAGNTQINSITLTVDEGGETPPDIDTDPIVPPADLVTSTYMFKSMCFEDDEDDDDDELVTANLVEYEDQVLVGFDNDDVYIQGLCDYIRDSWIKGTKNADGKYEIPVSQYMGSYDYYGLFTIDFYFTAIDDNDDLVPAVLTIDPETGVISSDQVMAINLDPSTLDYYMLFNGLHLAELQEIAAAPADPAIVDFAVDDSDEEEVYVMIALDIPAKSVNGDDLIMGKLAYQFFIEKDGEVQPLVFAADLYDNLDADETEIPYLFDDDWDFYRGGTLVYLNQPQEEIMSWTKIGVKSINYAGGETNESNIVWFDLNAYWEGGDYDGIAGATTTGDVRYFDLTGRTATANQKGILVKQVRQQDGTVTTSKVLRK